jgi:hypothetical protein
MSIVNKIKSIWNKNGFEVILIGCLIIIAILAITKIGKKGTWSNSFIYDPYSKNKSKGILQYIDNLPGHSLNSYKHNKHYHQQDFSQTFKKPQRDSSGEIECRRVLQKHFKRRFDKCRPDFLNNPVTGGHFNMELDCYDRELKIAVEYNGAQHYKYLPFFHKNKEAFYNQKYRDELKTRMCRDNGIILIEVPYTVKIQDIEMYIINELRKHSIHL